MGYDLGAARRRVTLTLNEDLVEKARGLTANLSATVEQLLAHFEAEGDEALQDRTRRIDQHVAASNAHVAQHGTLADAFSTF